MKKYFITYCDFNFINAGNRIISEAKSLNIFHTCIMYTRDDLSLEILNSPLLQYQKGGGFWSWKPHVVLKTFEMMNEGDVLLYVDSGCQLYKSKEWNVFWNKMKENDSIFFNINNKIRNWVKYETISYFEKEYKSNDCFLDLFLIAGGVFIIKKNQKNINLMNEWHNIMFSNPHLVMDDSFYNIHKELPEFKEHRHDQAILTFLIYKNITSHNIKLKWETFESISPRGQAIIASRNNTMDKKKYSKSIKQYLKYIYWHYIIYPLLTLKIRFYCAKYI